MAENPPYMNAYGLISNILRRVQEAQTPPRFTHDFLRTKLGAKSSSARAVISLLKRIGFLGPDGVPANRYDQFKNQSKAGYAMAMGIRHGYPEIFARNEYAHNLTQGEFEGLVREITGLEKKSKVVKAIVGTFQALKGFADFDANEESKEKDELQDIPLDRLDERREEIKSLGVNIGYAINLNLPETTNVAVYDAIFRSLKEHLFRK